MSNPAPPLAALDIEVAQFVAQFYGDPLGFARCCFKWPINGENGPDAMQSRILTRIGQRVRAHRFRGDPVPPVRMAVSTGHGTGKSVLGAMLVCWIMSTRPQCRGTITANTNDQLEKKTWSTVREWVKHCITAHWWETNSQIMYRKGERERWFCAPASCAEENSEAFAGQHAKSSTSFYINDEDSAVSDKIHEVEEGGLTDGEPMIFLFGNPTRNTGAFHRAAFGAGRDRWDVEIVDSRESKFSNKALIAEWQEEYGEESDFFRVRVRGLPPNASELQFIGADRIQSAQCRPVESLADEPLIAGVDVSGGGAAWTVCRFRRGLDARTLPPIRITGQASQDRNHLIAVLAEALRETAPARRIAAMFVDSAFGSPIVERLHVLGYKHVHEVNFGGPSPDVHCGNFRAFMWNRVKDWLLKGGVARDDLRLAQDLAAPGFHLNQKQQLILESKESMQRRGVASPDDGDALALTFAQPVALPRPAAVPYRPTRTWG